MKKKDVNAFAKFYSPKYVGTDARGRAANLTTLLASLKTQMALAKNPAWTRKVIKVSVSGNLATATVGGKFSGTMPMGDGKDHAVIVDSVSENVWEKTAGKWLLKSAKPISNKLTQDGKPVVFPSQNSTVRAGH